MQTFPLSQAEEPFLGRLPPSRNLRTPPLISVLPSYLVGVVEKVHGHAERQGVVIWVPQQDGEDLHTGRPGLPLSLLLRALHRALAVDGVLPHLSPGHSRGGGNF